MVTTVTTPLLSAEDIVRMGSQGERMELIDGVPREKEGVSGRHGEIEVQLTIPLGSHVLENQLGRIYPSDTQFKILRDPDIIHIPDLAFVRADRLPLEAERWHIMPLAPDLAVEVVSPNDPPAGPAGLPVARGRCPRRRRRGPRLSSAGRRRVPLSPTQFGANAKRRRPEAGRRLWSSVGRG
jgi:hypothetical protein